MRPVHNKAPFQLDRKRKITANLLKSLLILKTIIFKVLKTIRYQVKRSNCFIISN